MSEHIYVANHTSASVHVFAAESLGWTIADVLVDVGALAVGLGELKALATGFELPAAIETTEDLIAVMRIVARLLRRSSSVGSPAKKAADKLVDAFVKNSTEIVPGDFKDVRETGFLDYLSPSGIASLLGANTITLVVMADGGKKVVDFSSNVDESWIATPPRVVRSKYGTINVEDPDAGQYAWAK